MVGLTHAPILSCGQSFYKVEGHWRVHSLKPWKSYLMNPKYKQEVSLPLIA
jgi:hypothetical protein